MTAIQGVPPVWSALIIALAVLVGIGRLWLWQRAAPAASRASSRRLASLVLLQTLVGAALFLTLHPPAADRRDVTLVVATRGAASATASRGEVLVALPEAGAVSGAERVPDLATALRRHPETARIRVLGEGLPARDRESLAVPVIKSPAPSPLGLVDFAPPATTAPGSTFAVGGQVGALQAGTVELVDPAGAIMTRTRVAAARRFVLTAKARTEGMALFELRLRDAAGGLVERLAVPLHTRADPPPRVIVLAGAPGPEMNFLRRWAGSAGVELAIGVDLGGGVRLGEASPRLSSAELARTDLLVIDDRGWESLDAATRGLVARAVDGGMGLLLRPTAGLTGATVREWAVLGAPIDGGGAMRPLTFPESEGVPELARRAGPAPAPDVVSIVPAPDGSPLASWRARGRGRIGVWTVIDTYVLALAGRPEAHAELWSDLFSALGRPLDTAQPALRGMARVGQRATVCGLADAAVVRAPSGGATGLQIDPAAGPERCAAFWPAEAGWHVVSTPGGSETPLYVHSEDAAPSMRAQEAASDEGAQAAARASPAESSQPIPLNPFLAALLLLVALLWVIERRRPAPAQSRAPRD